MLSMSESGLSVVSIIMNLFITKPSTSDVNLEVLNPRGEIEQPKNLGVSPRLSGLTGKTIGLYDNGKQGFKAFLDVIENLLKVKFPTLMIKRYRGAFDLGDLIAVTMTKDVDAFIYGSGD